MTVALFKHHFCRRTGTGPKAHAHAAYLSGTKLDDGYGHTADFTPKGGILHAELWAPHNAPMWAKDRGKLWRSLELRESKTTRPADAILAHKFIGALPHELSLEENILYVKDYVREQFTRKGYAADWAIHAPDPGTDSRNYHVHIMVPLRKIENGDWAKTKDRFPKNSPALSQFIREKQKAFFDLQNRYLQKNGIETKIVRENGKWSTTGAPMRYGPSPFAPVPTRPTSRYAPPSPAMGSTATTSPAPRPLLPREQPQQGSAVGKYAALGNTQPRKGWPPEAIADWEAWGHRDVVKFFFIWKELAPPNFKPM